MDVAIIDSSPQLCQSGAPPSALVVYKQYSRVKEGAVKLRTALKQQNFSFTFTCPFWTYRPLRALNF